MNWKPNDPYADGRLPSSKASISGKYAVGESRYPMQMPSPMPGCSTEPRLTLWIGWSQETVSTGSPARYVRLCLYIHHQAPGYL